MSVKNILDGTIKIEGGGGSEMPDNPEVETLTATDKITTNNLTATGEITTKNITLTEGIKLLDTYILAQTDADYSKVLQLLTVMEVQEHSQH